MISALETARSYIARGWAPVPIPYRAKKPVLDGWEHLHLTVDSAASHFNSAPSNIGIILGASSNGLADVDLDCPEALELAPRILPATATFGRAGNPRSHWEYVAPGALTKQFKDASKSTLVELRATAPRTGNGQQTVFPGSTHKDSGEAIEWTSPDIATASIDADELLRLVGYLAAACLVKRLHPDMLDRYLADSSIAIPRDVSDVVESWAGVKKSKQRDTVRPSARLMDYGQARERFNTDFPLSATSRGRACPADGCEGKNSCKGDARKATCFHSSHPDKCGTRCNSGGVECFVFDPLDVEAFNRGRAPSEHLETEGYWGRAAPREDPPGYIDSDMPPDAERVRVPGADEGEEFVTPPASTSQRQAAAASLSPNSFEVAAPHVGAAMGPALALFRRRFSGEEKPLPLPWANASAVLGGGFWPGAHVLTGATGAGKTAFAMQVVLNAATEGHPVLYVGLELDTNQIIARVASLVMGEVAGDGRPTYPWSHIYQGKTDPSKIEVALGEIASLPIHIEEAPPGGWSAKSLRKRVESLCSTYPEAVAAHKAPLVVLDFLQLVGPTEPDARRHEELRERIGAAAYAGREVARRCGAVVLMLSSISRAGAGELGEWAKEGRLGVDDPMELVGMGKESGDIEFSADSVLTLAREAKEEGASYTPVWLAIAKQRAGRPGWSLLRFNGSWLTEETAAAGASILDTRKAAKEAFRVAKVKENAERLEREHKERLARILKVLEQSKTPMSIEAIHTRVGGKKPGFGQLLSDLASDGLTHQVMFGRKSLGWAFGSGVSDPIRTHPDSSGLRRQSASVRNPDGLPLCNRAGPDATDHKPATVQTQATSNSANGPDDLDAYRAEMARQVFTQDQALDVAESQKSEAERIAAIAGDALRTSVVALCDAERATGRDAREDA